VGAAGRNRPSRANTMVFDNHPITMKKLILPTLAGAAMGLFAACSHTTVNPPQPQPTTIVEPAPAPAPSQTTTTTTQPSTTTTTTTQPTQ
jgi:hypothetical protein